MRLNLGCGLRHLDGFLNIDREAACRPDLIHDLERTPWPFEDEVVSEVVLDHTLEHLGEDSRVYLSIVRELYRVCSPGAMVRITAAHPRHDSYLCDPTHVRPVTVAGLSMLSKARNRQWQSDGFANTPLALYLDVDFEVVDYENVLDPRWQEILDSGKISRSELRNAMSMYANVVQEIRVTLQVVKNELGRGEVLPFDTDRSPRAR